MANKDISWLQTIVRRGRVKSTMTDNNPDKSYGWSQAQNFNNYMEGVIGTYLFSINVHAVDTIHPAQVLMGRSLRR